MLSRRSVEAQDEAGTHGAGQATERGGQSPHPGLVRLGGVRVVRAGVCVMRMCAISRPSRRLPGKVQAASDARSRSSGQGGVSMKLMGSFLPQP